MSWYVSYCQILADAQPSYTNTRTWYYDEPLNWTQQRWVTWAQLFHIILLHIQATGNTTFKYTPVSTLCCVITKLAKPKWGYVFVLSPNTRIIYTPDDFNIKHSTFHVGALCLLLDKLNNTDNGEGFYCKDNYFITCVCLVREIRSENH